VTLMGTARLRGVRLKDRGGVAGVGSCFLSSRDHSGVPTNKLMGPIERFDETEEMKPSIFRIKLDAVE
jgi:hypothetical protein